jgi:hypothetical protein
LQNASDKLVRQQNMSKDMQVRAAEKIEALKAQCVDVDIPAPTS